MAEADSCADRICGCLVRQDIDFVYVEIFKGIIYRGLVGLSVEKQNSTGLITCLREKVKNA